MGLQRFIEQNLPSSWNKAAKKYKVKSQLCLRLYSALPLYYKGNKLKDPDVKNRAEQHILKIMFKTPILHAIDASDYPGCKFDMNLWVGVSNCAMSLKSDEEI